MAHEILERNKVLDGVIIVGLQTGGVPIAERIADALEQIEGNRPPVGMVDVALHRGHRTAPGATASAVAHPRRRQRRHRRARRHVLFTGRTVRAAARRSAQLRPSSRVQLAVMVDRGHRELPIRPDYVGKNLPTRRDEVVNVYDDGVDIGEMQK